MGCGQTYDGPLNSARALRAKDFALYLLFVIVYAAGIAKPHVDVCNPGYQDPVAEVPCAFQTPEAHLSTVRACCFKDLPKTLLELASICAIAKHDLMANQSAFPEPSLPY